jgi:predicted MFS family arabinose efflux permease
MLLFLVVTHFVLHTYTQLIPALLPTLQRELGVSLVQVSLLVSIPMMVNVVANIPAGIISDRIGPKILAVSFLVNIVGAFLIIISGEFYLLLLGAAFISAASTFYHPSSLKSASLIDPSKMNMALAAHLAGGTSGIATGPIILGVLMPIFGWRSAFLAWIPLNLILSVISYRIIGKFKDISKERNVSKTSVLNSVKSLMTLDMILVILAGALMEIAVINLGSFIPTYFQVDIGFSESLASIIYGLGPLTGIIGAFAGGSSGDRFGLYRSYIGFIVLVTGLVAMIPFTRVLLLVSILYILYRGTVSSLMPLMQSMIANHSPEKNRSLAFSLFSVVANIGASIAPIITSLLAETHGISIIFPLSIATLIPSMILVLFLYKTKS